jgi:hypothetical protein
LQEPFLKLPAFEALLTLNLGGCELKLAAPGLDDMRDLIEGPAERAGLSFEERANDGHSLAGELLLAVGTAADALPLLQMTLALLFARRDRETGQMRWADYKAIGRLEGAIVTHAETVLQAQPDAVQRELGPLLRGLTRPWLSLDGEIELRPHELDIATLRDSRTTLAVKLVEGRVLVADEGGRLRIVHEALLRHWSRAQELLAADLDLLRLKARLEPLLADWLAAGRDANDEARLIPPGAQLAASADALKRYEREGLGADLADFVTASVKADRRRRTRRQRILAISTGAFALLATIAVFGGVYAWIERGQAQANYRIALEQASGSVKQLIAGYDVGTISTALMGELVGHSQKTLNELPGETDEVMVARASPFGYIEPCLHLAQRHQPSAQVRRR